MKTQVETSYTGPSSLSQDNAPQTVKPSITEVNGAMQGHDYKKCPKTGFQRIRSLVKAILKMIEALSGMNLSCEGIKASSKLSKWNAGLQKINTLRTSALLRITDRFVKSDQSCMLSTLRNRKPGEGIAASIEERRTPPNPQTANKQTLEREVQRQKMLESAIPVREALDNAHTIISATKQLSQLQKAAKKNPGTVSQDDLQKINARLKTLKPLAQEVKQALASPRYRGLFARLFIP